MSLPSWSASAVRAAERAGGAAGGAARATGRTTQAWRQLRAVRLGRPHAARAFEAIAVMPATTTPSLDKKMPPQPVPWRSRGAAFSSNSAYTWAVTVPAGAVHSLAQAEPSVCEHTQSCSKSVETSEARVGSSRSDAGGGAAGGARE
jgi:hypothetical protein